MHLQSSTPTTAASARVSQSNSTLMTKRPGWSIVPRAVSSQARPSRPCQARARPAAEHREAALLHSPQPGDASIQTLHLSTSCLGSPNSREWRAWHPPLRSCHHRSRRRHPLLLLRQVVSAQTCARHSPRHRRCKHRFTPAQGQFVTCCPARRCHNHDGRHRAESHNQPDGMTVE